jgi:DNA-directed RNA polymerase sigma subunit (sigma70/sigma32)
VTTLQHRPYVPLTADQRVLAESHVRLASQIAWTFYRRSGRSVPFDELRSESYLALTHAACRFDASRGAPFGFLLRVAVTRRLAAFCRWWWARQFRRSLNFFETTSDSDTDLDDTLADPGPGPDADIVTRELVEQVKQRVPFRSFRVLWQVFGLGRTQAEVADEDGVSRQYIAQIQDRAVRNLRLRGGLEVGS